MYYILIINYVNFDFFNFGIFKLSCIQLILNLIHNSYNLKKCISIYLINKHFNNSTIGNWLQYVTYSTIDYLV